MKIFASHRLYIPHLDLLLRNQVIEIDSCNGGVVAYYPFREEIPFTEWLNGLIVLSYNDVLVSDKAGQFPAGTTVLYVDNKNIRSLFTLCDDDKLLKAYYITSFNVTDVKFSPDSRAELLV